MSRRVAIRITITSLFLFVITQASSQVPWMDSTRAVWNDEDKSDSVRTEAYSYLLWNGYLYYFPDSAIMLAKDLLKFGEKNDFIAAKHHAYNIMGASNVFKGDFPMALEAFQEYLKVGEIGGDSIVISSAYGNMAIVYNEQGNYPMSYLYQQKSMDYIHPKDSYNMGLTMNNIGNIHVNIGEIDSAIKYFERSIFYLKDLEGYLGLAHPMANLGNIYLDRQEYSKAHDYFQRSLEIYRDYHQNFGIGKVLRSIGMVYTKQARYDDALDYLQRSQETFKKLDDNLNIALTLVKVGELYLAQDQFRQAVENCKKAEKLLTGFGAVMDEKLTCECLYSGYKGLGMERDALHYLEKVKTLQDSIQSPEIVRRIHKMEFDRVLLEDSLNNAAQMHAMENDHKAEIRKKNKTRNIALVSGSMFLLLSWGFFNRWKSVNTQKNLTDERIDRLIQYEQLRKLDDIAEGQDQERKRISEDLHDKLGGRFTALQFAWSAFFRHKDDHKPEDHEKLEAIDKLIQTLASEVKQTIQNTAQSSGTEFGLRESLEELKYLVESSQKIEVSISNNETGRLSSKKELELYKIILELVGNALKYAQASLISIQLNETDGHMIVMVADDGKGFDPAKVRSGMGLKNIKARSERLGGVLHIDTKPGNGVTVIIEFDV